MEEKTYYYLYQVQNLLNGKVYVGVHKTDSLDDGYMGSGFALQSAIKKYGLDSFKKTILEFFEDADSMFRKEAEIVDDSFILRKDVYNLALGGNGGASLTHLAQTPEARAKRVATQQHNNHQQGAKNSQFGTHWITDGVHNRKIRELEEIPEGWSRGYNPVKVSKVKPPSHKGSFWITNGTLNRRVKDGDHIPEDWMRGRTLKE